MFARFLSAFLLCASFFSPVHLRAQASSNPTGASEPSAAPPDQPTVDRIFAREREQSEAFNRYSPIVETYIQELRPDKQLGIVPKSDFYFLGQGDFRSGLKVHPLLYKEKKGGWLWSYNPAGFLQMIFVDRREFDKAHYRLEYLRQNAFRSNPDGSLPDAVRRNILFSKTLESLWQPELVNSFFLSLLCLFERMSDTRLSTRNAKRH